MRITKEKCFSLFYFIILLARYIFRHLTRSWKLISTSGEYVAEKNLAIFVTLSIYELLFWIGCLGSTCYMFFSQLLFGYHLESYGCLYGYNRNTTHPQLMKYSIVLQENMGVILLKNTNLCFIWKAEWHREIFHLQMAEARSPPWVVEA